MRGTHGRRQLAIFAAAYLTYFGVRALTEGRVDRALANAASLVELEHWLGIAWEGGIQGVVAGSQLLQDVVNAVYIFGHWPVIIGAGVLLFRYRREHYYSLRNVCLLTGALGLFIFALFPVAPPRLTDLPLLDTVTRGASGYRQILPPAFVNQYAALPSFHAGWNLAVGVIVFRATRHWALRAFAVLMPAAMAFSVIATANHFVIDVIAGVGLVALAFGLEKIGPAAVRPLRFRRNYGREHGTHTVSAAPGRRHDADMPTVPLTRPHTSSRAPHVRPVGIPSRRTRTPSAPH